MALGMNDVDIGMAVGGIVGSSAEVVSMGAPADGLRLAAIGNALQAQGTTLTNTLGSPSVAAFNGASVGQVAMKAAAPTGPALTRQLTA